MCHLSIPATLSPDRRTVPAFLFPPVCLVSSRLISSHPRGTTVLCNPEHKASYMTLFISLVSLVGWNSSCVVFVAYRTPDVRLIQQPHNARCSRVPKAECMYGRTSMQQASEKSSLKQPQLKVGSPSSTNLRERPSMQATNRQKHTEKLKYNKVRVHGSNNY